MYKKIVDDNNRITKKIQQTDGPKGQKLILKHVKTCIDSIARLGDVLPCGYSNLYNEIYEYFYRLEYTNQRKVINHLAKKASIKTLESMANNRRMRSIDKNKWGTRNEQKWLTKMAKEKCGNAINKLIVSGYKKMSQRKINIELLKLYRIGASMTFDALQEHFGKELQKEHFGKELQTDKVEKIIDMIFLLEKDLDEQRSGPVNIDSKYTEPEGKSEKRYASISEIKWEPSDV
ncbi:hypothetical protein ACFL57_01400 [Candidatus Margulisiibacteriota bacterium]